MLSVFLKSWVCMADWGEGGYLTLLLDPKENYAMLSLFIIYFVGFVCVQIMCVHLYRGQKTTHVLFQKLSILFIRT